MPGEFSIAAEFRASKSAQRGASLRLRLRRAVALIQGQWQGDAPTWSNWRARLAALDAAVPPSFVAAMRIAHGASDATLTSLDDVTVAQRALWLAPRLAITATQVATVWQALATRYQIPKAVANAVTFKLNAPHGQCNVVVPGRVVAVSVRDGASAAAWHDCLHELGHAMVALCTAHDVPRAVDEAAAEVISAQLVSFAHLHGPGPLDCFADALEVAAQMRQHRNAIAQRLAVAEATVQPTTTAAPPWALWHDPGAQAAYVAAGQLAEPLLQHGFADRAALCAFVEQGTQAVDARLAGLPGGAW